MPQPLPASFAVAPQAPTPSDAMRRKKEPTPASMATYEPEEIAQQQAASSRLDFSDLGGTQRGMDFSDLGGQYYLHESELIPESERPIAFISKGRKFQAPADAWEQIQRVDPDAKQVQ